MVNVLDKIQGCLEKYQVGIVTQLGKIEKNPLFTSVKQAFLKLNFVLLLSSSLTMLNMLNNQFFQVKQIDQNTSYLIDLLTRNYALAYVIILAIVYVQLRPDYEFILTNLILYFSIISSFPQRNEGQLFIAMVTVIVSIPIVHLYKKIILFVKKTIQVPMEVLDNIILIFYFGILFILVKAISSYWFTVAGSLSFFEIINIDHPIAVFFIVFLEMLLWYLGINGYGIIAPFVLFFAINNLNANLINMNQGLPPTYIFTPNFWDYFVSVTGGGLVGALTILSYFSKKDKLKKLGKSSFIGNLFSVSEPLVFGLPIVMNKIFFLPFVIGTPILAVGQWYVFKLGWVNLPTFFVADFPLPFSSLLATLDFRSIILVIATLLAAILMYLPFFIKYEKQVDEEKQEDKYDDLDLDF